MKTVICQDCKQKVSRRKSYAVGYKGDGYIFGKTKNGKGITNVGAYPRVCKDRKSCKEAQKK